MRKLFLTRTDRPFLAIGTTGSPFFPGGRAVSVGGVLLPLLFALGVLPLVASPLPAQDAAAADQVTYPLNVAVGPDGAITIVDLDLPGLWQLAAGETTPSLFYRGPVQMRQAMNRPRCVLALGDGSVLVGDSASRDIYRITADTKELTGLTDGFIGIPMCLAVDPKGESVYVGDAEKRALFRFPLAGGEPQLVAQVNARGLSFDATGRLWALTPDDVAIVTIDGEGQVTPLVSGRPFQYPGGIVHVGQQAYVTDGYGKSIWRVSADGKVSQWFQGAPLKHPVGIAVAAASGKAAEAGAAEEEAAVLVADPHSRQIFRFPLTEKPTAQALLP